MKIIEGKYYIETVADFDYVIDDAGKKLSDLIAAPKDQTVLWSGSQNPFEAPVSDQLDQAKDFWFSFDENSRIPSGGLELRSGLNEDSVSPELLPDNVVDNYYGEEVAQFVANSHGGKTMEQVLNENGIVLPPFSEETKPIWDESSRYYASHAEGNVGIVVGEKVNPNGLLATVELPEIQKRHEEGLIGDINLYDSYNEVAGGKTTQHFSSDEFLGNDPSSTKLAMEHINRFATEHEQSHEYGQEIERQSDYVLPTAEEAQSRAAQMDASPSVLPTDHSAQQNNEPEKSMTIER